MPIFDEIPPEERSQIDATVSALLETFRRAVTAMPLETPPAVDYSAFEDELAQ